MVRKSERERPKELGIKGTLKRKAGFLYALSRTAARSRSFGQENERFLKCTHIRKVPANNG